MWKILLVSADNINNMFIAISTSLGKPDWRERTNQSYRTTFTVWDWCCKAASCCSNNCTSCSWLGGSCSKLGIFAIWFNRLGDLFNCFNRLLKPGIAEKTAKLGSFESEDASKELADSEWVRGDGFCILIRVELCTM